MVTLSVGRVAITRAEGVTVVRARGLGHGGIRQLHFGSRHRAVQPLVFQFLAVEVHRPQVGVGVVSAAHHRRGSLVLSVQIGHRCQESVSAVAVRGHIVLLSRAVIPVEHRARCRSAVSAIAVGVVEDGVYGLARSPFEHGQVLLSAHHAGTVRCTPVECVVGGFDGRVVGHLVHIVAQPVLTAGACTHDDFRLSVLVEVIDKVLRVVVARQHVDAHVDAPQLFAVQAVAVYVLKARMTSLTAVVGLVRGYPFHDDFILPVAIHIAGRAVVGCVGVGLARHVVHPAGGEVQLHHLVLVCPRGSRLAGGHLLAIYERHHLILVVRRTVGVNEVRTSADVACYQLAVAQEVEGRGLRIVRAQQAPAHVDASRLCRHGHHTACQRLHLHRRGHLCLCHREGEHGTKN